MVWLNILSFHYSLFISCLFMCQFCDKLQAGVTSTYLENCASHSILILIPQMGATYNCRQGNAMEECFHKFKCVLISLIF